MEYTYKFTDPADMIALAKGIATRVYWNESLTIEDEVVKYKDLWDIIDDEYTNCGAIAIAIYSNSVFDQDTAKFIRK